MKDVCPWITSTKPGMWCLHSAKHKIQEALCFYELEHNFFNMPSVMTMS